MSDLFAKHPNSVKDVVVAETICPLHQEAVKVSFELNGVRGKLTVLEDCSILHMGDKCNEACRKNPEILNAIQAFSIKRFMTGTILNKNNISVNLDTQ